MRSTAGGDGRLTARPGLEQPAARLHPVPLGAAPAPGVHRLADDALLLVPDRAGPCDLLVFFHGAGGSATSGLPLVRDTAAERGLLVLLPSSVGTTWDLVRGRPGPDVTRLDARLGEVTQRYAVAGVAFAGFSDGASYALSLGLANGDLVQHVLAFSPGFAAPPVRVGPARGRGGRPRVGAQHGTADAVLPVDRCGRRVVVTLRSAGYDVAYTEFDGGHVVPPERVEAAVGAWLDEPAG